MKRPKKKIHSAAVPELMRVNKHEYSLSININIYIMFIDSLDIKHVIIHTFKIIYKTEKYMNHIESCETLK